MLMILPFSEEINRIFTVSNKRSGTKLRNVGLEINWSKTKYVRTRKHNYSLDKLCVSEFIFDAGRKFKYLS